MNYIFGIVPITMVAAIIVTTTTTTTTFSTTVIISVILGSSWTFGRGQLPTSGDRN